MYLEFFQLRDFPFRLTPDTEFLYMSSAHARAKSYMDYTVWNREGFVVITGEIGCGKTTLIKKLLSELEGDKIHIAKIFQTQLDDVEFLQAVLVEFGLNPFNARKVELIDMLNSFLIDSYANLKQVVLIVDEAHNLSMKALEEIRLLSGLETRKEKVLHVILVGQPQLNEMLDAPEMEQLAQRVRLRFHLKALTQKETTEYIDHRLRIAGAERGGVFALDTIPLIYEYTGGVPRLINTLCDTALTCAYADNERKVTASGIREAIAELQWPTYAKRLEAKQHSQVTQNVGSATHKNSQDQLLSGLVTCISRIDAVLPNFALIPDKLARLEAQLVRIANAMQPDSTVKRRPKKDSGGSPGRDPGG